MKPSPTKSETQIINEARARKLAEATEFLKANPPTPKARPGFFSRLIAWFTRTNRSGK